MRDSYKKKEDAFAVLQSHVLIMKEPVSGFHSAAALFYRNLVFMRKDAVKSKLLRVFSRFLNLRGKEKAQRIIAQCGA